MKPQSDCLSAGRGERRIKEDLASTRAEQRLYPTVEIKMREKRKRKEKKRRENCTSGVQTHSQCYEANPSLN
jgi:hypothetical protein